MTCKEILEHARCLFHNPLPVLQGFPWERHAPAWLLEPGWSPAFPGGTGAGLAKWTSSAMLECRRRGVSLIPVWQVYPMDIHLVTVSWEDTVRRQRRGGTNHGKTPQDTIGFPVTHATTP